MQSTLMFHGIGIPGHPMEPGEENYWINWDQFDAIVDYCAKLPPDEVNFTFDDGNQSDLEAARRMRAQGVDGSFFVLVGRLGAPGYLTEAEVGELLDLGMEVGLHGRNHIDWRKADDATLNSEIDRAAEELGELCGRPVEAVAIPYGHYDRRVWTYLERSPFRRIHTSDRGRSRPVDRFVRREPVMRWHDIADVVELIAGKASPAKRLRQAVMPRLKRLA
ncbi:polysaccharide deacetylase family protein [Sphingomonas rhizophila]|uniref:Chitooligosaccharide deacetylase n=2 Tax=Sphingomonas rhizophila TaxID=2071607 RepID=A0A7G9S8Y0_9SPHN|nr:polysaccharide deacetylase family protein [Sphingomonas rhizophila]